MALLRLSIESPDNTFTYTGSKEAIKIGRSLNCEFNIPKDNLSREHALFEISEEEEAFYLTDLGSKNGITVNGIRLIPESRTRITPQDNVIFANAYQFKINPVAVQTKADMILKKASPDLSTKTFQIELDQGSKGIKRVRRTPQAAPELDKKKNLDKSEWIKMTAAFILILSFVLYQALGE